MLANFCILMGKPIEVKTQSVNIFICGQLYVFALFFFFCFRNIFDFIFTCH